MQIGARDKLPVRGSLKAGQSIDKRKRLAANARERKRMHLLNKAYDQLRRRLVDADNKSKYDVLIQAKEYIQALAKICDNFDKQHPDHPSAISTIGKVECSRANEYDEHDDEDSDANQHDDHSVRSKRKVHDTTKAPVTGTKARALQLDDYERSRFIVSSASQQQPLQSPLSTSSDCLSPMSLPDSVSSSCSSQHSNFHPYYSRPIQDGHHQHPEHYQQVPDSLTTMGSLASIKQIALQANIKTEPTLLLDHKHHQHQLLGPSQHLYFDQYHCQFYYTQKATL